jgi:glycosyltransferase involved in cell wall biosynthesis
VSRPTIDLAGGVVAYNERGLIAGAIASLLSQTLPENAAWNAITVVVSGSTDGTEAVVRDLAVSDPRIELVVQPVREGKSAAIAEVFRRARGDYLVLLNGDAHADPGAVKALLDRAPGPDERFAVMGRPVPPHARPGTFAAAVELMWSVHHTVHLALLAEGTGNHLSDELLLLPVRHLPPLGPGIINDGSFVGGWLSTHAGALCYAPRAGATIVTPASVREHVRQRRRIRFGHRQIREELSVTPLTITRYAVRAPRRAMRLVAGECRVPGGVYALATLSAAEVLAAFLALVDRRSSGEDHLHWRPIGGLAADPNDAAPHAPLSAESG